MPTCPHPVSRVIETRSRSYGYYRRRRCLVCETVFATRDGPEKLSSCPPDLRSNRDSHALLRHRILVLFTIAPDDFVITYAELARKMGMEEYFDSDRQRLMVALHLLRSQGWVEAIKSPRAGAPNLQTFRAGPRLKEELA